MPLWTNRYNGQANGDDRAIAVAADSSGNVFVTGSSWSSSRQGYATIKYSGAGVPLWTNHYNGPGIGTDQAAAMAVDSSGNIFVTGSSTGSGHGSDYVTIKYSNMGAPVWTNRYDSVANDDDRAFAVAVDGSGNVFVTGSSDATDNYPDYATIKYSSAGVALWTNRYSGPPNSYSYGEASAVAVDGGGNVFVTGSSGSGPFADYLTIAYSGAGVTLWTNRYNGPAINADSVSALAVGGSGNVFVTGGSYDIFDVGDFVTIAYSSAGAPLWTNYYNGPGDFDDFATDVAVDGSGNVFVTGPSHGSIGSYDYATIKYSGAGVPLWTNRYNGPANNADEAQDLAVDSSGNVVVTGISLGAVYSDYLTIKYSGAGVPLWTNRYNGPGNNGDFARALTVDSSGNVFVTGDSWGGTQQDYATIAYSGAGVPLWTNRYHGPANGNDFANAIAVDRSGNVFVSGHASGYATIKYSGAGVPMWTNRFHGSAPVGFPDSARAVAVDAAGTVFVTGDSYTSDFVTRDYVTIAYSNGGASLWTNRYNGPANGDDVPLTKRSLVLGPDGSVYVAGGSDGDYSDERIFNFATVKYTGSLLLTIARTTTNTVAISWPSGWTGFTLQENRTGIGSVNWSDVLMMPTDDGTMKTVIVNLPTGNRFYRLKSQ